MSSSIDPTTIPPLGRPERQRPRRQPNHVIHGTVPAHWLEWHPEEAAKLDLPTHDHRGNLIVHHALPQRALPAKPLGELLPGQKRGEPATYHRRGKGRSIYRYVSRNVGRSKY